MQPLRVTSPRWMAASSPEMRTATVSAVATQLLARRETPVLAILASGVQARSHLEALRLVREFREVRVWSPRNARIFAERSDVQAAGSAEEAVRGADVVVVATIRSPRRESMSSPGRQQVANPATSSRRVASSPRSGKSSPELNRVVRLRTRSRCSSQWELQSRTSPPLIWSTQKVAPAHRAGEHHAGADRPRAAGRSARALGYVVAT